MAKFTSHYLSLRVDLYLDGAEKEPTTVRFEDGVFETDDAKVAKALAAVDLTDIGERPFVVGSGDTSSAHAGAGAPVDAPLTDRSRKELNELAASLGVADA